MGACRLIHSYPWEIPIRITFDVVLVHLLHSVVAIHEPILVPHKGGVVCPIVHFYAHLKRWGPVSLWLFTTSVKPSLSPRASGAMRTISKVTSRFSSLAMEFARYTFGSRLINSSSSTASAKYPLCACNLLRFGTNTFGLSAS